SSWLGGAPVPEGRRWDGAGKACRFPTGRPEAAPGPAGRRSSTADGRRTSARQPEARLEGLDVLLDLLHLLDRLVDLLADTFGLLAEAGNGLAGSLGQLRQ